MSQYNDIERLLMLDKTIDELGQWENSIFDKTLDCCNGRVILFGAGKLGRNVLSVLRANGIEPLAFSDNNENKWGQVVDGLSVLSPIDAGKLFGENSLFVITVFDLFWKNNINPHINLRKIGCKSVLYYSTLFWKYGNHCFADSVSVDWLLKPSEISKQMIKIKKAYELMEDESKELYLEILKSRVYYDGGWEAQYTKTSPHFCDLIKPSRSESFVDCGAFDGDTLNDFLMESKGEFNKYFAFEPMPDNIKKIVDRLEILRTDVKNQIEVLPYAVGSENIKLYFEYGAAASHATDDGSIEVQAVKLDDIINDKDVTWMKMDIEGAEIEALKGARNIIVKNKPKLTICVYHKSDDLWNIPLLINEMCKGYKYYLRIHDSYDIICYAVPE